MPVSQFQLRFAPIWIAEKSIQAEKDTYYKEQFFKELHIKGLPKKANVVSRNHLFQEKWRKIRTKE